MNSDKLIEIQETYNVMSFPGDLLCASLILKNLSNVSLMELGCGGGGWPLSMKHLGVKFDRCILIDDFSWMDGSYYVQDALVKKWHKDPESLQLYLSTEFSNCEILKGEINSLFHPTNDLNFFNKINVLRIDCFMDESILDRIIDQHLSFENFIFIDDARLNCGFERVRKILHLINSKNYYPIWIGEKEVVLHNKKETAEKLVDILTKLIIESNSNCVFPTVDSKESGIANFATCYTLPHSHHRQ